MAGRFWDDGVAGFTEIGVLAHRAGVLFEPKLDRIISGLSVVEIGDGLIGLLPSDATNSCPGTALEADLPR